MPDAPTAPIPNDARRAAMASALTIFATAGRARRMASDATVPFCPPLENLRYGWLLYAAATREFDGETIAYFRDLMRDAVRQYRALRAMGEAP